MMNHEHIRAALKVTGVPAEALDSAHKQSVIEKMRDRLGVNITARAPWDDRHAPDGRQRNDGWGLITSYVADDHCLMFLSGAETIWRFSGGPHLAQVLRECPPLEFYVCDEGASYLLCSNQHDVLIGWGTARGWVESLTEPL